MLVRHLMTSNAFDMDNRDVLLKYYSAADKLDQRLDEKAIDKSADWVLIGGRDSIVSTLRAFGPERLDCTQATEQVAWNFVAQPYVLFLFYIRNKLNIFSKAAARAKSNAGSHAWANYTVVGFRAAEKNNSFGKNRRNEGFIPLGFTRDPASGHYYTTKSEYLFAVSKIP